MKKSECLMINYTCDYCGYQSCDDKDVERHEQKCLYNPETKKCMTCKHNKYALDFENNWVHRMMNLNFCNKGTQHEVGVYTCDKWLLCPDVNMNGGHNDN